MLSRGGFRTHLGPLRPLVASRTLTLMTPFNRIVKDNPAWATKKVPTRELLDRLREQELFRKLRKDDKWEYLSEAHGTLASLPPGKNEVTLAEIEQVLPRANPVAWTVIHDILNGAPDAYLQHRTEEEAAGSQFMRIHSVGRTTAARLATAGLRTLDDFAAWPKITASQRLSLNHLPDMDGMIPRQEMDSFKARLEDVFDPRGPSVALDAAFEIVGPFRCGLEYSPGINVLVYSDGYTDFNLKTSILDDVYRRIVGNGLIEKDQMLSVAKRSDRRHILGYTRANHRTPWRLMSLKLVPRGQLPLALVQETGDAFLWRVLRGRAKRNGYRLYRNNVEWARGTRHAGEASGVHGVVDRPTQPQTEKQVFHLAKLPYLEPHQRVYRVYRDILPASVLEETSAPWDNQFLKSRKQVADN